MINSLEDFIYQHPEFSNPERKGEGFLTDCPVCHKRHMYVSLGNKNNVICYCQHVDCNAGMEEVVKACGISRSDFFIGEPQKKKLSESREHIYHYENGNIFGRKIIKKYAGSDKKEARWEKYENGSYINGLKGATAPLFNLPTVATSQDPDLFVVEGERDVETMKKLGFVATSLPNGGNQTKWADEYTKYFKNKNVYIITDNDETGQKYGKFVAINVYPVAESVKIVGARDIYPDVPQKGDISDIAKIIGDDATILAIGKAIDNANAYSPEDNEIPFTARKNSASIDKFLSLFVTLDQIEEVDVEWFIKEKVAKGTTNYMGGDGGSGKSSVIANLIASETTGKASIIDEPDYPIRSPGIVAFFTTEESIEAIVKKRIRQAGADQSRVITFNPKKEEAQNKLREFYFDSDELRIFIENIKPTLCIFDPIQGFVPPDLQMGNRNAMRHCLSPLIWLGENYGTTFILIGHTNKRHGAYGRDRLADSADIWDLCRSVFILGTTEDSNIRYISNEKNNYAPLAKTVLFSINDNGQVVYEGETYKRDREFMSEKDFARSKPMRRDCKQAIFDILQAAPNKVMLSDDLMNSLKNQGYTLSTIRRAKEELKNSNTIKNYNEGFGQTKVWKTALIGAMPLDS